MTVVVRVIVRVIVIVIVIVIVTVTVILREPDRNFLCFLLEFVLVEQKRRRSAFVQSPERRHKTKGRCNYVGIGARCQQKKTGLGPLPDWLNEGASVLLWLSEQGVLERLEALVRINRTGYAGFDVFLTFVVYFATHQSCGIREFCGKVRRWRRELAALVGRRLVPSSASISRALKSAEFSLVRSGVLELLTSCAGTGRLLEWKTCQTWDTQGQQYHVFDFDHTSEGVLQRALPTGEALPAAKRRGERYAVAGYLGRKRGDLKRTRSSLQHAGTGLWLGGRVGKGNSDPRGDFEAAVATVRHFCAMLDWSSRRAVIRGDGAFGSVPYLSACIESGVCLVSRSQRYDLLEQTDVQSRLAEAQWYAVPSSGTEPQRSAAELGMVTLPASEKTYRAHGTRYEPVQVRVVVSRFQRSDGAAQASHGRLIDGFQYELFVSVGLEPSAFPAAELVSMFFQRTAQENRFAQEDRELGLQRLFSENPAGQEFAMLAGLFVWNFRIARGFELADEEHVVPPQKPRTVNQATAPERVPDRPESAQQTKSATQKSESINTQKVQLAEYEKHYPHWLSRIDWKQALRRRPDWQWTGDTLICPAKQEMRYQGASFDHGKPKVRFRAPPTTCASCNLRSDCMSSVAPHPVKTVHIHTGRKIVEGLQELTRNCQELRTTINLASQIPPCMPQLEYRRRHQELAFAPDDDQTKAGPYAVYSPLFLPAQARKLWRENTEHIEFYITLSVPKTPPRRHRLVAADDAHRQHRRLTWHQRLQWNRLHPEERPSIELHTPTGRPPPWAPELAFAPAA